MDSQALTNNNIELRNHLIQEQDEEGGNSTKKDMSDVQKKEVDSIRTRTNKLEASDTRNMNKETLNMLQNEKSDSELIRKYSGDLIQTEV